MSSPKIRFGIREKLFFLILIAFSALILATFWQVGETAQRVSAETIGQSLQQSRVVLDTKIESRFSFISEVATSIARDGRILPLVYENEVLTLQDQSLEFQQQLDFDILFFTDAVGGVLARSDRPQAAGQNMAGKAPFFDSALEGKAGQGYFLSQGRLMQIVAVPIFDNVVTDLVRGTVALAYEFSSDMANEIVSLTSSEIGFFSFTRDENRQVDGANGIYVTDPALATYLENYFADTSDHWQPLFADGESVQRMHLDIEGEEFYAVARRIENDGSDPLGFVMVLRSSAELLKPFTDIQQTVLLIGGACLGVAILLAGIMSIRISRPIIELVTVARNIQGGMYPAKDTAPKSADEIGVLYTAVVEMGNTLKEKAELENYLAQISTDLNIDHSLLEEVLESDLPVDSTLTNTNLRTSGIINETSGNNFTFSLAPGTKINERYEVLKLIGQGAVGSVFLAQDTELDERVALKILSQEIFSENDAVNIKEEIRLARKISNRNILRTFDIGSWDNYTYISMEYVLGYDLDQLIKSKGAQDVYIALLMGRQICSAMNAAHEEGVIHLDLKPGNMMINRQGILKIMDFGLARRIASQDAGKLAGPHSTMLMGTPRYMAPEQFLNETLDQRTDIYSIGIILYTLITGIPPFSDKEFIKMAEMHLHQDLPEIVGVDGQVSRRLDDIIRKAAAKNPDDRYQTVREMLEQLNTV